MQPHMDVALLAVLSTWHAVKPTLPDASLTSSDSSMSSSHSYVSFMEARMSRCLLLITDRKVAILCNSRDRQMPA